MVGVPGFGYDRRASLELPAGFNHTLVEAFHHIADLLFGVAAIEHRVQFRILSAKQDCRWSQAGEILAPDQAFDPPIGIGVLTQVRDWFTGIFEVVKLAPGHGVPDQVVRPLSITDPSTFLACVGIRSSSTGFRLLVGSPVGGLRGPKFGCPLESPLVILCGPVIHRLPPPRLVDRPFHFRRWREGIQGPPWVAVIDLGGVTRKKMENAEREAAMPAQQPGVLSGHVVLLGDSIFDNQAYVDGGPDVVQQLRQELPGDWSCTLLAVDGNRITDVVRQLRLLPPDTTHLVVSVGGNDALGFAPLLEEDAGTVTDALLILAKAQDRFTADYDAMLDAVVAAGLLTAVSTIYDTPPSGPGHRTIRSALALFNDAITRAAFGRGVSLLDVRLICNEDQDYANPIEPSAHGGRKIARAVAALVLANGKNQRSVVVGTEPPDQSVR